MKPEGCSEVLTALGFLSPPSVASLSVETLPLLAVTFITENSLVAAVSLWLALGS